jgi:hypothetical protein
MPRCKTLRLYFFRTLGIKPRNDSAERARVPPSFGSKWNTWTAWMLMLIPVHPISRGWSTDCSVETRDAEPDFQAYEDLVRETRRVAGPKIRKAWDEPALTADADVHTEGIDFADLKPFDDGYLREVRDHLSVWPRWISAMWRGGEK